MSKTEKAPSWFSESLALAPQDGALTALPALPATIDAAATAAHVRAVLAGERALPEPIARQVACLLAARHPPEA